MAANDRDYPVRNSIAGWASIPLGVNLVVVVSASVWIATETANIRSQIEKLETQIQNQRIRTRDRLTGQDFIHIQNELRKRNPEIDWLSGKDVREIQKLSIED